MNMKGWYIIMVYYYSSQAQYIIVMFMDSMETDEWDIVWFTVDILWHGDIKASLYIAD